LPLDDVVPLFATLLSVPLPERYPPLNLTPQRQRQKTHEALVAWLLEETERQSVLAVWEDLHWADPSTLDVLSLMLDHVPTARMLTFMRAEFQTAQELGEQLLTIGQRTHDPAILLPAYRALGMVLLWRGKLVAAHANLERGIALYDPYQHRALAVRHGDNSGVTCLDYAAFGLWVLGYPDQALTRVQDALTLARTLSHPLSLARALCFAATCSQWRREVQATQVQAEEAVVLATTQGFPHWLSHGIVMRGWARAAQGHRQEGISQIQEGRATFHGTGAEVARPVFLALLAEVYGTDGQALAGLACLTEALAMVAKHREHFYEAELYRLKGGVAARAVNAPDNGSRSLFS
jgi:hypothetical protein